MSNIGKICIVRCDRSGVFYGKIAQQSGSGHRILFDWHRKIWYWEGAAAIEQIARDGCESDKMTVRVEGAEVYDAVLCLPCTEKAMKKLDSITEWTA